MAVGIITFVAFDVSGLDMEEGVSFRELEDRVLSSTVSIDEDTAKARAAELGHTDIYIKETVTILKGRMTD